MADFDSECAKVFAAFSPPITAGTYSSVSSQRQADVNQRGDKSPLKDQQSEHFVPNSNLQAGPGRTGPTIPGGGNYTEGTGFAYNVYDDQLEGTEHKWLTDMERDFAQKLENQVPPKNATLNEWLDHMEKTTADGLEKKLERKAGEGVKRSRIKDAKKLSPKQRKKLAQAAAKCLRTMAEKQFAKKGVSGDTPLRNGQAEGAPPAPVKPPRTGAGRRR